MPESCGFPIRALRAEGDLTKEPQTIGEHLKKKRFSLGLSQTEAARQLGVTDRTLSLWEREKVYSTWPMQPRIKEYLG